MSEPSMHDKVDAFADGELPPDEAQAFREHLATCTQCQAELRDIMMLAAATAPLAESAPAPVTQAEAPTRERARRSPDAARPRRRGVVVVAIVAATAAAALVLVWRLVRPAPIVLAEADARPLEPRLTDASADRWRPYDVARSSGSAREEVPLDVMATLERRGDWRRLAEAYLLAGEPQRAGDALARAGDSADVASDRAATALAEHDPAAALMLAARALALSPRHAQAAWNRALALRDLGLARAAAIAFDELARRGERGWSDEARQRAQALRTAWHAREQSRRAAAEAARRAAGNGASSSPPSELERAWPQLFAHERALAAHDPARDPFVALAAAEHDAAAALARGDSTTATTLATAALARARAAGADPRELPRRLLLVLAGAARAQGKTALADAYADEARLLQSAAD